MLDSSDCIDIANAKCKFLKSAKEADVSRKSVRKEYEEYVAERESGLSKLSAESEKIVAVIVNIGYDRDAHNLLLLSVKKYREAKDQLASLAADAATADALRGQDADLIIKITSYEQELDALSREIAVLENETG